MAGARATVFAASLALAACSTSNPEYRDPNVARSVGYPELAGELAQNARAQSCRLTAQELAAAFLSRGISSRVERENILVGMILNKQAKPDPSRESTLVMTSGVCK